MMSLQDLVIKDVYRSKLDDLVHDFYIPVLSQSIIYKRSVGFFSSSSLIEISKGICNFVKRGGKIYLVTSPCLSEEDVEAIKIGYRNRNDIIKDALIRELHEPKNNLESERLNLLANLIAYGILDIKVAIIEDGLGIYHEKLGIMEDEFGNIVAFSGSMNESKTAMRKNYEAVDVFCSWDEKDVDRVNEKKQAFDAIWGNYEIGIDVLSFPAVSEEIINRYRKDYNIDYFIDDREFKKNIKEDKLIKKIGVPDSIKLRTYQEKAIENWAKKGYKGIFDMATGTGKTYTALAAISKLYKHSNENLAVIIICPYQHLVEQWREDVEAFGMKPIICYSASSQKNWRERLKTAVNSFNLGVIQHFCMLSTNATFSLDYVQTEILKLSGNIVLVVDEAHNFGAEKLSDTLLPHIPYRLALSATIDRHGDEEGTRKLYNYFGDKCIEYTLEDAINARMLTPYYYHPIPVSLNEEEPSQCFT
jgi:HKD family nuclease